MRRLAVFAVLLLLAPAVAGGKAAPADPSRIAVAFDALPGGPDGMPPGARFHGWVVESSNATLGVASMSWRSGAARAADLAALPGVRYVEPDPIVSWLAGDPSADAIPADPGFGIVQYAPQLVNATSAWDRGFGSTAAAVCVVDTGIRYTHEDLAGARWRGGQDVYLHDGDPWDFNGHGTHVAGIAAASVNNGKGIAGMGNVALYGVRVLDGSGFGPVSAIAEGIAWCADNTPRQTVVNLSLGTATYSDLLTDAVAYAASKGKLVVAAAGNDGTTASCSDDDCVAYPAALPSVLAVSCVDESAALCDFSSRGPEVDLAAPGDAIASTYASSDASYAYLSGTSMATPAVSGAAALLWSREPTLTAAQVRARLLSTAADLGDPGPDPFFGAGLLDAGCAIACVADLGVSVSVPATALQATPVSANVTVTNSGPMAADAIKLTIRLARLTPNAVPGNCTRSALTLTCTVGPVPVGGSQTLALDLLAGRAGPGSVRATVAGPAADPVASNNTALGAILLKVPMADLAVSLAEEPPADPNATLGLDRTLRLGLSNAGPQQPSLAWATVRVPFTYSINGSALPSGCALVLRTVTCTATDLSSPASWLLNVTASRAGTSVWTAMASSPLRDPSRIDNRARLALVV